MTPAQALQRHGNRVRTRNLLWSPTSDATVRGAAGPSERWRAHRRSHLRVERISPLSAFAADRNLHQARICLDRSERKDPIDSVRALSALRVHWAEPNCRFDPTEVEIRDAMDAFLTFMTRISTALESGLVDCERSVLIRLCRRFEIERPEEVEERQRREAAEKEGFSRGRRLS